MKKRLISRLENFWYYHKVHILIALLALLVFVPPLWELVTAIQPDYSVAIVSRQFYEDAAIDRLQEALTGNARDLNGDGRVLVTVMYYQVDLKQPAKNDTGVSALDGDLIAGKSGLFLLEDPQTFQRASCALTYLEGGDPPEQSMELDKMVLPVSQVSGLRGLGFDTLSLGLRLNHPDGDVYRELLKNLMD